MTLVLALLVGVAVGILPAVPVAAVVVWVGGKRGGAA